MPSTSRSLVYTGVAGALAGVVLGPHLGESRRAAWVRLRQALRTGRGSLDEFAGTPCSTAGPTSAQAAEPAAPEGTAGS